MKKCGVCGMEYPAEQAQCSCVGESLASTELEVLPLSSESSASDVPPLLPASLPDDGMWADRRTRIIEVGLVCMLAFARPILSSAYYLVNQSTAALSAGNPPGASTVGTWS
jgi:hypothetical protein